MASSSQRTMEEARTAEAAFRVRLAHNHESTLAELIEENALARNRMGMMEEDIRQQNLRVQMHRDEEHIANEGWLMAREDADIAEDRLASLMDVQLNRAREHEHLADEHEDLTNQHGELEAEVVKMHINTMIDTAKALRDIDSHAEYDDLPEPIKQAVVAMFRLHVNAAYKLGDDYEPMKRDKGALRKIWHQLIEKAMEGKQVQNDDGMYRPMREFDMELVRARIFEEDPEDDMED